MGSYTDTQALQSNLQLPIEYSFTAAYSSILFPEFAPATPQYQLMNGGQTSL